MFSQLIRQHARARSIQVRSIYASAAKINSTGYTGKKHRSNAEELIAKFPVVEVDANVAVCDGGGGNLGHPVEYIQLNTVKIGKASVCKYCGIRYVMKQHH
eukprot:snap_masked-scaffold_8-processed-gene-1.16-mRNA-1 protein AED:0.06 eAED:0.06 QI:0/-1/0/1/-1/1/1/0/100